jgi:hypothetical protein
MNLETANQLIGLRLSTNKIVNFPFGLITLIAVSFLNSAHEFFRIPSSAVNIVVRQFPPLAFDFALQLVPFSFQHVFVHRVLLSCGSDKTSK